jgi:PAS domain S-box-containing protein
MNTDVHSNKPWRSSEVAYRAIFEQSALGMGFIQLADYRWLDVNSAFCKMLSRSRDNMLATALPYMTHFEDVGLDAVPFQRMARGELDSYQIEKRLLHDKGHNVSARLTLSLIRDVGGNADYAVVVAEDIRDHKAAEEKLAAINAGRLGTWSLNLVTGELTTSEMCRLNFGRSPTSPFSYAELCDAVHPDDKIRMAEAIERSVASGADYDIEYRILTPAGEVRWLAIRGQPIYASDGAPLRMMGVSIDVTEKRRTEHKQSESEARYRQIVEGAEDFAIVALDEHGTITAWNRGAEGIVGYAADDAIGRPGAIFFTPEDREAGVPEREMNRAKAAGRAVNERWHIRKDGSRFWGSGIMMRLDEEGSGYVKIFRDRTAEHEAEAALRESEQRFRLMADAVPQIIWITDRHGQMEFLNKQFVDYTGAAGEAWSPAEMAANFIHPGDGAGVVAAWKVALETGEPFDVEHRIRSAAGEDRWFLARAEPYRDPETGAIVRWFGVSVDIHDRKMAEAALRESEIRYRILFDTIDEGFCVIEFIDGPRGPMSNYVHFQANPAYVRHTGIPDIVGKTGREVLTEGEADAWVAIFRGVLETGEPVRFERELEATERHLELACFRVEPAAKRQVAVLFQDVTARKWAEQRLRELNDTLENRVAERTAERDRLWSLSQDLLARANYDGRLMAVSPSWAQVLGWSEAELLARPYASFMHPDDMARTLEAIDRMAQIHQPARFENRISTRDGDWKHIEWTVTPEPNGENFVAIGRDLSLNKARQAELEQTQEALRQSHKMEAVGQLTGGLAHDFNNLLASISSALQVLKFKNQRGQHSGLERYIDIGESSVRRAASLTHRLLAFSRRQTLDPKPTDVSGLIAGIEELIRRSIGPMVELEVVTARDLWPTKIDPSQLENAVLNLCINARDAMMPGGGKLTLATTNKFVDERTAREQEMRPGDYISLCVSDTGMGMAPEVVTRIFDPFFTTKPLGEGTGLGLSMVYGFVRQSDGQVHVHSEVGVGTSMCLYLPRYAGLAQTQETVEALPMEAGQGETVLLIEDEHGLRDIVGEVLRDAGYRVLTAQDGPTGLQVLNSDTRVDLLLTDVGLPGGLNGRQVADAARAHRPNLKVLFITGYASTAAVGNGRLAPGMEVMTKPFEISALVNSVRALIDARWPS